MMQAGWNREVEIKGLKVLVRYLKQTPLDLPANINNLIKIVINSLYFPKNLTECYDRSDTS